MPPKLPVRSKTATISVVSQQLLLTVDQIVTISLITHEDVAGVVVNIGHIVADIFTLFFLFLANIPSFEKIKLGLCYLHAVSVSVFVPLSTFEWLNQAL
jgi:uncharacterized membrane protein YagU involved in acid resistance